MVKPSTHMGVKVGIEVLAGRSLRKQSKQYVRDLAPLIKAIEDAKSEEGLKKLMSANLVKKMGTKALTTAVGEATFQADLIARTEASVKNKEKNRGNNRT